jgi:hypothetical protein
VTLGMTEQCRAEGFSRVWAQRDGPQGPRAALGGLGTALGGQRDPHLDGWGAAGQSPAPDQGAPTAAVPRGRGAGRPGQRWAGVPGPAATGAPTRPRPGRPGPAVTCGEVPREEEEEEAARPARRRSGGPDRRPQDDALGPHSAHRGGRRSAVPRGRPTRPLRGGVLGWLLAGCPRRRSGARARPHFLATFGPTLSPSSWPRLLHAPGRHGNPSDAGR